MVLDAQLVPTTGEPLPSEIRAIIREVSARWPEADEIRCERTEHPTMQWIVTAKVRGQRLETRFQDTSHLVS